MVRSVYDPKLEILSPICAIQQGGRGLIADLCKMQGEVVTFKGAVSDISHLKKFN